MSQFFEQAELFDQVLRLEEKERQEPFLVIEQFFSDYRLHECRHILWSMVEACLTSDYSDFSEPEERADLLLRYDHLEKLVEASYLLLKERKEKEALEGSK
ncbi:MAG TPA: hypothetical protein VL832_02675 [Puia sp.]|jgi:hypothetical protein|nr:hypothetical protein [Puia sp.]